jgi:3-oxoacyl-[acyl-carrier protein] reductase
MDLELRDRVVLVAGSSQGIGLAIARAFLRERAKVVITGRGRDRLEKARESLCEEADSARILAIQGNLTVPEEIDRSLEKATSAFGGLNAVVANVGSGTARGGWDLVSADWGSVLQTNLQGSMLLASKSIPLLKSGQAGSLTFIASIAGLEAINAPVTYAAAKAGLLSAMKSLARLLGPEGVRVNAVAPGNVLFPGGTWEAKLKERRDFLENYIQTEVPLQRFGSPEEIADAVVFIASARASFMTGTCVVVDGGQTRAS